MVGETVEKRNVGVPRRGGPSVAGRRDRGGGKQFQRKKKKEKWTLKNVRLAGKQGSYLCSKRQTKRGAPE